MSNTPTPIDGLAAAVQEYLEYTEGHLGSPARDRLVRELALYEYAKSNPTFLRPVNVQISHDKLGALTDLLLETRRLINLGDVVTTVVKAEIENTLGRLDDVLPHELARGNGGSLL